MVKAKGKNAGAASRRKFIQGLGGGALATAALSSVGCQSRAQNTEWAATYDWICVGSGIHGCGAAIQGHENGMKTVVLEKKDRIGGISVQGGSGFWVPMNYLMKGKGIQDSKEDAMKYFDFVSGGYARPEYTEAIAVNATRVLDFLHQKEGINFTQTIENGELRREFFHDSPAPGRRQGRLLGPGPFRNSEEAAKSWPFKLSLSSALNGFTQALNKIKGYEHVAGGGPARGNQSQLAAWKRRLGDATYNELIKQDEKDYDAGLLSHLLHVIVKRGIEVRLSNMAEELVVENGRVVGVTVSNKGKIEHLRANRGVLLATGGNPIRPLGDTLAWMLAARAGALVESEPIIVPRIQVQVPGEQMYDGTPFGRSVEVRQDPSLRSSFIANRFGKRFGNEWLFSEIGSKVNHFENWKTHKFENIPNYIILDQKVMERTTFGGYPPPDNESIEWISKGRTIGEVADKLKVDRKGLEASVERFNGFARRGKDDDFGRPRDMEPLDKAPFYGVQLATPDPFQSVTLIEYTPNGQCIHYRTGEPIAGLYTCGGCAANAVVFGMGYQSGQETATGQTLGMLAAEHAARAT